MAILHGSWIEPQQTPGYLLVWGEVWRRGQPLDAQASIREHPLAMSVSELLKWVQQQQHQQQIPATLANILSETDNQSTATVSLPTKIADKKGRLIPLHSASTSCEDTYLFAWQIPGICLSSEAALQFLQAIPLQAVDSSDSWLGTDLRFWSHITRWGLDLLARSKFLPSLDPIDSQHAIAGWHPLLDSATDQVRWENFASRIPQVCLTYQPMERDTSEMENYPVVAVPSDAKQLLFDFLHSTIDTQVRQVASNDTTQKQVLPFLQPTASQWLQALGASTSEAQIESDPVVLNKLSATLTNWKAPLQQTGGVWWVRAAFELQPPKNGERNWYLAYLLQAVDDPNFTIGANQVWNHATLQTPQGHTISYPQESLLRGLGLACRLYPTLENSLQSPKPTGCPLTPQQAYEFIKTITDRFEENGLGVILPPSLQRSREGISSRLGLSIQAKQPRKKTSEKLGLKNLLNFQWKLSLGGHQLTKEEFQELVAQNSPLVEVDGEWVELRQQDVEAAQEFFTSRKEGMNLTLEDALRLATGDTQTMEKLPVVNFEAQGALEELLGHLTQNRSLEAVDPPQNFHGTLRPYQSRGVSWLLFLQRWGLGACLADDMGLGKTIQAIAFLLHLQERDELEAPVLLVCPTSVLGNWQREASKFAPSLRVQVHHGSKRKTGQTFAQQLGSVDLVITSYALVTRDVKTLTGVEWQGVILDEAQNIKNPNSKQSQSVRKIPAQFRMALTGTPLENRLQELWSILDFLNPGYLGSRQFFQKRFAKPIEKYGDTSSLQALRSLAQPFILRRLKTDRNIIQDLPEKNEMPVFCGLTPQQASLYQSLVNQSLEDIESAAGIERHGKILALLVKLKQVCNHPILLQGKGKQNDVERDDGFHRQSAKLQRLQEMLEELISEGDRALIFTQFAEWGKLLKPYLEKKLGREVFFLYGATRKKQREEMVDRFQNDPQGPPVMILSLKAGGTGLNLTRANHVFHYDRWWNPAVENQASDRAFRIGQTRNVQVHKFVSTGTLEEKIHNLLESKQELAEQVVGTGEDWLTQLDTEQLRNLLVLDRNAVIDED